MTEIQGRADSMMEEIKAREVSVMSVNININYSRREQKRSHSVQSFPIQGEGGVGVYV